MKESQDEAHDYLPSGEWEGFYCYGNMPHQHKMEIELSFTKGRISGSGTDDVGGFIWKGSYTLDSFEVTMNKHYATHEIFYKGDVDENGIWGTWENVQALEGLDKQFSSATMAKIRQTFANKITGGFHIWPKKAKSDAAQNEAAMESEILKKLFHEIFQPQKV